MHLGAQLSVYLRPTSLTAALDALAQGGLTVIAGGTDYYPARVGKPAGDDLLDITGIESLRGIADAGDHWRIGATTSWSDIIGTELPPAFDGLKAAAREIGGRQIQNAGTVAGNLCNASPAADGVPPLLALDARVELSGVASTSAVPLADFIIGNRRTRRQAEQLLTAILVPKMAYPARGGFAKLGSRRYLVISIVMAAAVLEIDAGKIAAARIAVGACSAVAQRLPALEAALAGCPLPGLGALVQPAHLATLSPIDDVRGSASYRHDAALTVLRRLLDDLGAAA